MNALKENISTLVLGILNSYAQIFFAQNKVLAINLLVVTFFDFDIGFCGLIAVTTAQITAVAFGNSKVNLKTGLYSFNALLVGLAIGFYYELNFFVIIFNVVVAVLTYFITIWLSNSLAYRKLPFLSLPFVMATWLVVIMMNNFNELELSVNHIDTMNQLMPDLTSWVRELIEKFQWANLFHFYFRSLGAIVFQYNDLAGILIAIALLLHSRISFLFSIVGFFIGYAFYYFFVGDFTEIVYAYVGFNFILTAIALGGFFLVASKRSFLWLIIAIPITVLLISFFTELFRLFALPIYSLPYNVIVLLILTAVGFNDTKSKLQLVTQQFYQPEKNLHYYKYIQQRYLNTLNVQFTLPFIGEWRVSQGYNGKITHIGSWQHALDFDIERNGKTYKGEGINLSDYYCYKLPVLAPADGVVVKIIDGIADNEIGEVDTVNNWGNTIIIKHVEGVYSKLSHLKKGSFKVGVGQYVKRNQVLAKCGNSGRSPEPHLHFQLQTNEYVDAGTLDYPLKHYLTVKSTHEEEVREYSIPEEQERVKNLEKNNLISEAFNFQPNNVFILDDKEQKEELKILINEFNQLYFYNEITGDKAFFYTDDLEFYFTDFEGSKNSLLYRFYLVSYHIQFYLGDKKRNENELTSNQFLNFPLKWLDDLLSPFCAFSRTHFIFNYSPIIISNAEKKVDLRTACKVNLLKKVYREYKSILTIEHKNVTQISFDIENENKIIRCEKLNS